MNNLMSAANLLSLGAVLAVAAVATAATAATGATANNYVSARASTANARQSIAATHLRNARTASRTPYARRAVSSHARNSTHAAQSTSAEITPIATLHLRATPQGVQAVVENRLDGPVQVALSLTGPGRAQTDPALPARAVIEPRSRRVLTTLVSGDADAGGDPQLELDAIPGDPDARPVDVEYVLPLRGAALRIDQVFGGSFSHDDDANRFAVDFAMPVGTVVVAARDGVVMQAEWRSTVSGSHRDQDGERANLVRVLHDDGSMAVYGHLQTYGVVVRGGQRVSAGQQIGLSGNTGFSTGPHLHFAVQVNRGMHLESIRFRMRGPDGPLRLRGNF